MAVSLTDSGLSWYTTMVGKIMFNPLMEEVSTAKQSLKSPSSKDFFQNYTGGFRMLNVMVFSFRLKIGEYG